MRVKEEGSPLPLLSVTEMEFEELLRKLEQIEKKEKELLIALLERERLSFKGFDQLSRLLYERRKIHALLRNIKFKEPLAISPSLVEKILKKEEEIKSLFESLKAKILAHQKEVSAKSRALIKYQRHCQGPF